MKKFGTTPRKPMMYFWGKDLSLTGTGNQRDNDHDGEQAEIHCEEIDNHLTHKNLITPNYVIDNNMEINFGGEITIRCIDEENDIWGTSDGLMRNTKMFLLGLSFRNFAVDKSIFDKYVFRVGTKIIKFEFITEVGEFIDANYKHTNKVIKDIVLRDMKIQDIIDDYYNPELFNQNFFVLEQLGKYRDWVSNHNFKSDKELLTAFEQILNLYRVSWAPSTNDVDSFSLNSGEKGVPANGISLIANKVLSMFQLKYLKGQPENFKLNESINQKIKAILSPIRKRVRPIQENCIKILCWVLQSRYATMSGYVTGKGRGGVLDVTSNEIMTELNNEMENYADRDKDGEIKYTHDDEDMLTHFDSALDNWGWYEDLKRINKYFEKDIITEDGKRWIPLLLKYQRETLKDFTIKEIRVIQNIHYNGKFVLYDSFDKLLGTAINEVNSKTNIIELLTKYFVSDNTIEKINYKSKLIEAMLTKKVKDRTNSILKKYNYLDNVIGHCSLKNTKLNWVNINPMEVGTEECEHFLAYLGITKSEIRFYGINFFNIDKTTNGLISDDPIDDKKFVVRDLDGTIGQLFKPNNKLEDDVKSLLNTKEFKIFQKDSFSDKDWVEICSVGIIGDNVSNELPNNLIYKYRSVQIDNYLKKVFNV